LSRTDLTPAIVSRRISSPGNTGDAPSAGRPYIIRAVSGGKIPVTKAPKTKAPEEQTAPQEPLNRSVANS